MSAKCKTLNVVAGEVSYHVLSDALAYVEEDKQQVLLVCSLIGDQSEVHGAAEAICAPRARSFTAFVTAGPFGHDVAYRAPRLVKDIYGYHHRTVRLGYNTWHCMMISSRPGLLLNSDDETLWAELSGPDYNTPILRSWIPYVKVKLLERKLLQVLPAIGCSPGLLTLESGQLDKIVKEGVTFKKLELK